MNQELTEREEKLISYLKVMINFMTIWGIYEQRVKEVRDWAFEAIKNTGASNEWQNEMLHNLETDFGIIYRMLDPNTLEEKRMAITVKGGYECGYCHKFFTSPVDAEACKDSHNLIYLALSKDDLNRLVTFIFTKEDRVLGEKLVDRLQSYLKGSLNIESPKRGIEDAFKS